MSLLIKSVARSEAESRPGDSAAWRAQRGSGKNPILKPPLDLSDIPGQISTAMETLREQFGSRLTSLVLTKEEESFLKARHISGSPLKAVDKLDGIWQRVVKLLPTDLPLVENVSTLIHCWRLHLAKGDEFATLAALQLGPGARRVADSLKPLQDENFLQRGSEKTCEERTQLKDLNTPEELQKFRESALSSSNSTRSTRSEVFDGTIETVNPQFLSWMPVQEVRILSGNSGSGRLLEEVLLDHPELHAEVFKERYLPRISGELAASHARFTRSVSAGRITLPCPVQARVTAVSFYDKKGREITGESAGVLAECCALGPVHIVAPRKSATVKYDLEPLETAPLSPQVLDEIASLAIGVSHEKAAAADLIAAKAEKVVQAVCEQQLHYSRDPVIEEFCSQAHDRLAVLRGLGMGDCKLLTERITLEFKEARIGSLSITGPTVNSEVRNFCVSPGHAQAFVPQTGAIYDLTTRVVGANQIDSSRIDSAQTERLFVAARSSDSQVVYRAATILRQLLLQNRKPSADRNQSTESGSGGEPDNSNTNSPDKASPNFARRCIDRLLGRAASGASRKESASSVKPADGSAVDSDLSLPDLIRSAKGGRPDTTKNFLQLYKLIQEGQETGDLRPAYLFASTHKMPDRLDRICTIEEGESFERYISLGPKAFLEKVSIEVLEKGAASLRAERDIKTWIALEGGRVEFSGLLDSVGLICEERLPRGTGGTDMLKRAFEIELDHNTAIEHFSPDDVSRLSNDELERTTVKFLLVALTDSKLRACACYRIKKLYYALNSPEMEKVVATIDLLTSEIKARGMRMGCEHASVCAALISDGLAIHLLYDVESVAEVCLRQPENLDHHTLEKLCRAFDRVVSSVHGDPMEIIVELLNGSNLSTVKHFLRYGNKHHLFSWTKSTESYEQANRSCGTLLRIWMESSNAQDRHMTKDLREIDLSLRDIGLSPDYSQARQVYQQHDLVGLLGQALKSAVHDSPPAFAKPEDATPAGYVARYGLSHWGFMLRSVNFLIEKGVVDEAAVREVWPEDDGCQAAFWKLQSSYYVNRFARDEHGAPYVIATSGMPVKDFPGVLQSVSEIPAVSGLFQVLGVSPSPLPRDPSLTIISDTLVGVCHYNYNEKKVGCVIRQVLAGYLMTQDPVNVSRAFHWLDEATYRYLTKHGNVQTEAPAWQWKAAFNSGIDSMVSELLAAIKNGSDVSQVLDGWLPEGQVHGFQSPDLKMRQALVLAFGVLSKSYLDDGEFRQAGLPSECLASLAGDFCRTEKGWNSFRRQLEVARTSEYPDFSLTGVIARAHREARSQAERSLKSGAQGFLQYVSMQRGQRGKISQPSSEIETTRNYTAGDDPRYLLMNALAHDQLVVRQNPMGEMKEVQLIVDIEYLTQGMHAWTSEMFNGRTQADFKELACLGRLAALAQFSNLKPTIRYFYRGNEIEIAEGAQQTKPKGRAVSMSAQQAKQNARAASVGLPGEPKLRGVLISAVVIRLAEDSLKTVERQVFTGNTFGVKPLEVPRDSIVVCFMDRRNLTGSQTTLERARRQCGAFSIIT